MSLKDKIINILNHMFNYLKSNYLFMLLIISFFIFKICQIYATGIGTDEGNFLYIIKLINEGNVSFLDFYIRENASLLFLLPFFKIVPISIINLRWFVFILQLISLIILSDILKKVNPNKNIFNTVLLFITVPIMSLSGAILSINLGIFYHFFVSFSLLFFNLCLGNFLDKLKNFFIVGALTGISILTYKGTQIFLLIIPIMVILKYQWKNYYKKIFLFIFGAMSVIFFYWVYYGIKTSLYFMYKIVLSDVLTNILIITAFLLIIKVLISKVKININSQITILILNILLFIGFFVQYIIDPNLILGSFYSGIIVPYGFVLIILQTLNIIYAQDYKKELIAIYTIINVTTVIFAFGSRGFFVNMSEIWHWIGVSIFLLQHIVFIFLFNKNNNNLIKGENINEISVVFIQSFFIITSLFGGYIMPTRFSYFLIYLPILCIIILNKNLISKTTKICFYILIIISVIYSTLVNIFNQNDYSFYSIKNFNEAVSYIKLNTNNNQKVLSLDTAVLAEIKNYYSIKFYSPWQFINNDFSIELCYIEKIPNKFKETDTCLNTAKIVNKLTYNPPDYILGSWRSTIRIFDTAKGQEFLNNNYILDKQIGRFLIYKRSI